VTLGKKPKSASKNLVDVRRETSRVYAIKESLFHDRYRQRHVVSLTQAVEARVWGAKFSPLSSEREYAMWRGGCEIRSASPLGFSTVAGEIDGAAH
jgi:hypothetical protein